MDDRRPLAIANDDDDDDDEGEEGEAGTKAGGLLPSGRARLGTTGCGDEWELPRRGGDDGEGEEEEEEGMAGMEDVEEMEEPPPPPPGAFMDLTREMEEGVRRMVDTSTRLHDPLPLSEGEEERGESRPAVDERMAMGEEEEEEAGVLPGEACGDDGAGEPEGERGGVRAGGGARAAAAGERPDGVRRVPCDDPDGGGASLPVWSPPPFSFPSPGGVVPLRSVKRPNMVGWPLDST